MLEQNEEAMRPELLPGYVWLDTHGRRTHVWAAHLEYKIKSRTYTRSEGRWELFKKRG